MKTVILFILVSWCFISCNTKKKEHLKECNLLLEEGRVKWRNGNLDQADSIFKKAEACFSSHSDSLGIAKALANQGLILKTRGYLHLALEKYNIAENIFHSNRDDTSSFRLATARASLYSELREDKKAEEILQQTTPLYQKGKNLEMEYINIFYIYADLISKRTKTDTIHHDSLYENAIEYTKKGINIAIAEKKDYSIMVGFEKLGKIFFSYEKCDSALYSLNKAIEYGQKIRQQAILAQSFHTKGLCYLKKKNLSEAKLMLEKSIVYFSLTKTPGYLSNAYSHLKEIEKEKKNFQKALEYDDSSAHWHDIDLVAKNRVALNEAQVRYDTQKKETENQKLKQSNDRQFYFVIAAIFVLCIGGFAYWRIRKKNAIIARHEVELMQTNDEIQAKNNLLEQKNQEIQQQQQEIVTQNEEIRMQMEMLTQLMEQVEHLNHQLNESINYAQGIQKALLPKKDTLENFFPENFILYQPHTTVSGDFYWWQCNEHNPNEIHFSLGDCTGHAIPGSIMTAIFIPILRKSVKIGLLDPKDEIEYVNKEIYEILTENSRHDTAELTISKFDRTNNVLTFTGSRHSIYLLRNSEVIKLDTSRNLIGKLESIFEQKSVQLEKGDIIYLTSDGYFDQLGGPNNKKMTSKRFVEKLLTIHTLPMDEQVQILKDYFAEWCDGKHQIDDVCVMGLKIT